MRVSIFASSLVAAFLIGCGGGGGGGDTPASSSSSISSVASSSSVSTSSSSSSVSSSSSSSVTLQSYSVRVVDDAVVGATIEATECTGSKHVQGSEYNLSGCATLPTVIKAEGGFVDANGDGVQDANETSMGLPLLLNAQRFGIKSGFIVTPLTTLISNAADVNEVNKTAVALGISYDDLFGDGQQELQQKVNAIFVTAAANGISQQLELVKALRARLIEKDGNFTYAISKLEGDLAASVSSVFLSGFIYDAGEAVESADVLDALKEYNVGEDQVVLAGFIYDGVIADANITVRDSADGSLKGIATSDANGRWSITLERSILDADTVLLFEGTGRVSGRKVLLKAAIATAVLRDLAKNRITASDALGLVISNVTTAEVAIIGKGDQDALKDPAKLQKAKEEVKTVKKELLDKVAAAIKAVVDLNASDLNNTDSFTFVDTLINGDGTDINTSTIDPTKLDEAQRQNEEDKILSEQLGSTTPGEDINVTLPFEGYGYDYEYGWNGTTQFLYYQRTHVHLAQTAVPAVYDEYNSGSGWSTTVPGEGYDLKLNPLTGGYIRPENILATASIPAAADTVLVSDAFGLVRVYLKVVDEADISNQTLQLAELGDINVTFSADAKMYTVRYRVLTDQYWIGWNLGQTDLVSMVNAYSGGRPFECEEELCYGFESNVTALTATSRGNIIGFRSGEPSSQTVIGTWHAEKLPKQNTLSIKVSITHPDYQMFVESDQPLMTMYNGMAVGGRFSPSMVEFAPVQPIYNAIAAADIDQKIDEVMGGASSSSSSSAGAGVANDSPLVGAWALPATGVPMDALLVNLDNEHYFMTQQRVGMNGEIGGVEVGFMTLEADGNFSNYMPMVNTNAEDTAEGMTLYEVNATTAAILGGPQQLDGLQATAEHPERGAWIVNYERYEDSNYVWQVRFALLVLDGAGTYMVANVDTGVGNGLMTDGGRNNMTEFGSYAVNINGDGSVDLVYTPDAATDLSAVCTDLDSSGCDTLAGDSNGEYGFTDPDGSVTAHYGSIPLASLNEMTVEMTGAAGPVTITMQRIVPNGPFDAGVEPW